MFFAEAWQPLDVGNRLRTVGIRHEGAKQSAYCEIRRMVDEHLSMQATPEQSLPSEEETSPVVGRVMDRFNKALSEKIDAEQSASTGGR